MHNKSCQTQNKEREKGLGWWQKKHESKKAKKERLMAAYWRQKYTLVIVIVHIMTN